MPPRKTKTAKQSGAKLKKDSAATAKKFEVRVKVTVVDDAITSVVRSATRVVIDATPTPDATRAKDTPKDDIKQEESESPFVEQIIDAEAGEEIINFVISFQNGIKTNKQNTHYHHHRICFALLDFHRKD